MCVCAQVCTRMLVPALADTRCRVGRRAFPPGEEEGCTFHCEETLTDAGTEQNRTKKNETRTGS